MPSLRWALSPTRHSPEPSSSTSALSTSWILWESRHYAGYEYGSHIYSSTHIRRERGSTTTRTYPPFILPSPCHLAPHAVTVPMNDPQCDLCSVRLCLQIRRDYGEIGVEVVFAGCQSKSLYITRQ